MLLDNNATRIRREIMVRVAQLCFEDELISAVDRLPVDMRPKGNVPERCCVYKERAVIKYRIMAILGFGAEEETDELTPLSEYAGAALKRTSISPPVLTVLHDACSACIYSRYFITNACRGCFARPCALNCPKKCISFEDGQAHIDHDACVNCGRCLKACPYHAIIHVPIPCEEECPVGAISKDETGKECINPDSCILCGKCMTACPFGAIMEKSQMVDVIRCLKSDSKTIALIAPSIVGQFSGTPENTIGALKNLGFDAVVEVAAGADVTARNESVEFGERMQEGDAFMTSSCCTAYKEAVEKHIPELHPYVSETATPMHYAAEIAKERYPDDVTVFIGPCTAKRIEGMGDPLVDYVLTFEELGAMLVAHHIDVQEADPQAADIAGTAAGRGFPVSGGVAGAISTSMDSEEAAKMKVQHVDGINKQELKRLRDYAKSGVSDCNMLEVMCCEGGCVAGPCTIGNPKVAARKVADHCRTSRSDS
ncbi:MAG TPA: monomeric [FeFe] hydrogenase [Armatimonadota bacterium]|jgi:[FeFe] hydrogenase (group B1/B3)